MKEWMEAEQAQCERELVELRPRQRLFGELVWVRDDVGWLEKRPWKVAMCPVGALVSLRRQSADAIRQLRWARS